MEGDCASRDLWQSGRQVCPGPESPPGSGPRDSVSRSWRAPGSSRFAVFRESGELYPTRRGGDDPRDSDKKKVWSGCRERAGSPDTVRNATQSTETVMK